MGRVLSLVPGLVLLGAAGVAQAAPQDVEATRVAGSAISEDYVSGKFTLARQKLEKAIKVCNQGKCSARVLARLYRDLGVVYLGGLNKAKAGKEALTKAVQTDPSVPLDPDLTTPEIAAAFREGGGRTRGKKAAGDAEPAEAPAPPPAAKAEKPRKSSKSRKAKLEAEDVDLDEDSASSEESASGEGESEHDSDRDSEGHHASAQQNFFSLGVQQDFLMLKASDKVCDGPDYSCFGSGDVEYTGNIDADKANRTEGGFGVATTRILLGYDRRFTDQILAGVRLGLAFRGAPASSLGEKFLPLHLELRGAYYFGDKPFTHDGFRPFAGLSAGVAEVDGHIAVDYFDNGKPGTLDAWRRTGKSFLGANAGSQYAFGKASAISAEVRLLLMLGTSAIAPALGLSYVHAL